MIEERFPTLVSRTLVLHSRLTQGRGDQPYEKP
jgi:hypothetical protein